MDVAHGFEDFVAIVEHGSISAAARERGVPRATMSRRLASLEDDLGVRLIHRSTRSMTLTRAGEALYRRARRVVEEARAARDEVQRHDDTPRGLLRVSIPPGVSGEDGLGCLMLDFLDRWPEVRLEVLSTARHVDVVAEGFDVALRAGPLREDGLVSRIVWRTDTLVVATPALAATHGAPTDPAALSSWPCVVGFDGQEVPERGWPLHAGGSVPVSGRFATNDLTLRAHLAVQGYGAALLPRQVVAKELAEGRLVPLLEGVVGATAALRVAWPERAYLPAAVRAFIDHAVAWIGTRGLGLLPSLDADEGSTGPSR